MHTANHDTKADNHPERHGLCLPMQAGPVDRTPAGAARAAASGAEACFSLSDLTPLIGPALGVLSSI